MKQAYLKDLQSRLLGHVTDDLDALEHFSTDQSIFQAMPTAIVYPHNTADVRKTVLFSAERTAAGRPLPVTARGLGSSTTGGALGEGLQLVLPTHMHKILRIERDTVTVQPGISVRTLQQTLHTHFKHVPQLAGLHDEATIGGVVAVGEAGEKAVKYGSIQRAVKSLKVVLADGSLIETRRLSARELNRKKGHTTLEGEIYRRLDSLLLDHKSELKVLKTVIDVSGYNLDQVRHTNGSFDLTPVFIGALGTLGVITEITLTIAAYNPRTTLVAGYFTTITGAMEAVKRLRALEPSAVEFVDQVALDAHLIIRPHDFKDLLPDIMPFAVVLVEFDNASQFGQKLRSTRAARLMHRHGASVRVATDPVEQLALWKLRRASVVSWLGHGAKKALSAVENAAVPVDNLPQLLDKTSKLLKKHDLEAALWGHIGIGNLRFAPRLDLGKKKDVDKLITFTSEYYDAVVALGGSPAATHTDNLLQAAALEKIHGKAMLALLVETKHIFDAAGVFTPQHKTGITKDYLRAHLRSEYNVRRQHIYLVHN